MPDLMGSVRTHTTFDAGRRMISTLLPPRPLQPLVIPPAIIYVPH